MKGKAKDKKTAVSTQYSVNSDFTLVYNADSRRLDAQLFAAKHTQLMSESLIKARLEESDYADFVWLDSAFSDLLAQLKRTAHGTVALGKAPDYSDLTFNYDDKTHRLTASVTKSTEKITWTLASVEERYAAGDFCGVVLEPGAFDQVLAKINAHSWGTMVIGEKPTYLNISFEYEQKTRKLFVVLTATDREILHNFESVSQLLAENDFSCFNLSNRTINDILGLLKQKNPGRFTIAEKAIYSDLRLVFNSENGDLIAVLTEAEEVVNWVRDDVEKEIRDRGFEEFYFETKALDTLMAHIAKHEHGEYVLAQRKDGAIKIEFDEHKIRAYITVSKAYGGRPISLVDLFKAISLEGINSAYYREEDLKDIVHHEAVDKREFACAKEPIAGEDTRFEALVEEYIYLRPEQHVPGQFNINNIKEFVTVAAGTPLLRRIPPTPGTDGCNLLGKIIPAKAGENIPFSKDCDHTQIDPADENMLLAEVQGHPSYTPTGVRIEQTLMLKNVNKITGDIYFDGSILIRGEVVAGLKVEATADIIVKDMVVDACLIAGNDITVANGIVGSEETELQSKDHFLAQVIAGGSIHARYISLAWLDAGNNICVKEYIGHCRSYAGNQVLIGQAGGKGILFGGKCRGNMGVELNELGSDSGILTRVMAGKKCPNIKHYNNLLVLEARRLKDAKQLTRARIQLRPLLEEHPQNVELQRKEASLSHEIAEVVKEINLLSQKIKQLKADIRASSRGHISVRRTVHPNVTIYIGSEKFSVRQKSQGGRFTQEGSIISWK